MIDAKGMVLQYDQEKGEATTSTAYDDITSTEDASFAEEQNTTCSKTRTCC